MNGCSPKIFDSTLPPINTKKTIGADTSAANYTHADFNQRYGNAQVIGDDCRNDSQSKPKGSSSENLFHDRVLLS
jgi:hypothetical protein